MKNDPTPTDAYKHMNHHHELTEDYEMVALGGETFVANKQAVPLLKALNELGLKTRTHHVGTESNCFISILLDNCTVEVKRVFEIDADRIKYNGKYELLICWNKND